MRVSSKGEILVTRGRCLHVPYQKDVWVVFSKLHVLVRQPFHETHAKLSYGL